METIPFAREAPGPDLLPLEELADCAATVLARDGKTILSYGSGAGYTPLRELIGEWFGVHPYRVVLTNGWLHGFTLLMRNLVQGRTFGEVEYPTTIRADDCASLGGRVSVSVVPIGENGLVTRSFQNTRGMNISTGDRVRYRASTDFPTGWTMSAERRRRTVIEAQNRLQVENILLIEDESYALTRFEARRSPRSLTTRGSRPFTAHRSRHGGAEASGSAGSSSRTNSRQHPDPRHLDLYITPRLLSRRPSSSSSAAAASSPISCGSGSC